MCGFIVRWLATEESLALDRTQGILTHMKERLGTDIHLWRRGNIIRLSNKKQNPIFSLFLGAPAARDNSIPGRVRRVMQSRTLGRGKTRP